MKNRTNNKFAYILLLPSFIFLIVFTIYPIIKSIFMSFFQKNMGAEKSTFVGLGNYKTLMGDAIFWRVIKNNLIFSAATVSVSMILALTLALFLNNKLAGRGMLRTMFFYPTVMPMIAAANVWLFIYTPVYGMLDHIRRLFGLGSSNLLGSESTVMLAMIIMCIWKETGYLMIFFLAGLQNIPKELIQAADLDGAGRFQKFKNITLPLLRPTTLFVFILSITNSFKMVDHLIIMTDGGPNNASNLLLYYIYQTAFKFWNQGMASTLTVVMLVLMMTVALFRFFKADKEIYYS